MEAVGIGMFRELGVLLTAIIVAGRSGSAFTAQIGTMQVNQEVDAMRTIGLNPIEWLVMPRISALVISMPLLAFWGDMTGLLGGAVACTVYLDFTFVQFFERLRDTVGPWHFYVGMIKAPVFGCSDRHRSAASRACRSRAAPRASASSPPSRWSNRSSV